MRTIAALLLAVALALGFGSAQAAVIVYTETFDDYQTTRYLAGPYHECSGGIGSGITWLNDDGTPWSGGGFIETGFCDHDSELEGNVYFRSNRPFTLLSYDSIYQSRVISSRGGSSWSNNLEGDALFQNVDWIGICVDCDWSHHHGAFDNVRFSVQVPEPGTALLVVGALGILAITRRRRDALQL